MLLSPIITQSLQEKIVWMIAKNPKTGPEIFESLQSKSEKIPKETFYRTLRKLLADEILAKNKKVYEVNRHWLVRIRKFIDRAGNALEAMPQGIQDGDRIVYTFKNPNAMGIFWAHLYDEVFDSHDSNIPILVFHPHEWLIYIRRASELLFLDRFQEESKQVFFALGGKTVLDKKFTADFQSKHRQIGHDIDVGLGKNEYINVLGDYIFKIKTGRHFADTIEHFFNTNEVMNDSALMKLQAICQEPTPIKMVFTKSKKESALWYARFKKYFHISKVSSVRKVKK